MTATTERTLAEENALYDRNLAGEYAAELDKASDIITRVVGYGAGRLTVAGHLARLFPADGQDQVDPTWLESAGFGWCEPHVMTRKCGSLEVIIGELSAYDDERPVSMTLGWEYRLAAGSTVSMRHTLADNPTRDDVRRLFAALGDPLTESGEG